MKSLYATVLSPRAILPEPPGGEELRYFRTPESGGRFATLLDTALSRPGDDVAAAPQPPPPARYVVQPGDNLWQIGKKLGVADPLALADANDLPNPDLLAVGQVLKIPANVKYASPGTAQMPKSLPVSARKPVVTASTERWGHYVVQAGDNLWKISQKLGISDPLTLARLNHLPDPDRLAVGQVLSLPPESHPSSGIAPEAPRAAAARPTSPLRSRPKPREQVVVASWYGGWHHGRLMANGKPFDMYADTVAHKSLPFGTRLRLTNPTNGRSVIVTVTDRGPYIPGRDVDVSYGVARTLGIVRTGVARLKMEIV